MICTACGHSLLDSNGNSVEIKVDGLYFGILDIVALRCPHCGNERPKAQYQEAIELLKEYKRKRSAAKKELYD